MSKPDGQPVPDADLPPQSALPQTAPPQSAPTHFGYVGANGADPEIHGTYNMDDFATHDDVEGLRQHITATVSKQASAMQSAQASNSNLQQLGQQAGVRLPPRPQQVSPLEAARQHRQGQYDAMANSVQNLRDQAARRAQINAGRQQAASAGIAPPRTTNGMSAGFAEKSFFGQQSSGNGTAPSTWESSRWQSPR